MNNYVQLSRGNDWGTVYFGLPGKTLTSYGSADARQCGIHFVEGASIRVQWPNGTETTETIVHQQQSQEVSDMGKSYTTRYNLAGLRVSLHGAPIWLPMDTVKVCVDDIPVKGDT